MVATSCGSRKKEVHRQESRFSFKSDIDTSASFSYNTTDLKTFAWENTASQNSLVIEYTGENGDSISIVNFGADGKIASGTTIKGKGRINVSSGNSTVKTSGTGSELKESEGDFKGSSHTKINGEGSSETLDKKAERKSNWLWLWLLLALIAAGIVWYIKKHTNWFARLKNHVTK
jgi:hypothetical protein